MKLCNMIDILYDNGNKKLDNPHNVTQNKNIYIYIYMQTSFTRA